jgi:hypothetical protein
MLTPTKLFDLAVLPPVAVNSRKKPKDRFEFFLRPA